MKIIRICQFTHEKNHYDVAIGNGITRRFSNRKTCLAFLADCNRFLNLKLHEANFIYADLYAQFRRNWFYFDHHKSPGAELYSLERSCRQSLRAIEDLMDLIVDRSSFTNGNHFVFTHFSAIFNAMHECMRNLQLLQTRKSSAVDIHKVEVLYLRVLQLEKELFTFDGTFTRRRIDVDEAVTRNKMMQVV